MKAFVISAFALVSLSFGAEVGTLTGLPAKPFLYVEGKASVQKAPDIILMNFEIEAHNADQAKANEEVQAKAKKVFGMLRQYKIEDRDLVAEDLSSQPEYERDQTDTTKRGKLIGYVVSRNFKITVRDLAKYGKLGDEIMRLGGVSLSHISGEVSDRDKLGEELWPKAIQDARDKAEKTLKPLGMKIDSVFAVSSIDFGQIAPELLRGGERVVVTGMNVPTPPDEPSEYRPEMVTIESTAHVIYLISPAK